MAEISAATVKALREETGLGMMECKKALAEAKGDPALAKDILRKKGLATAEKKAGRATSEGLIGILANDARTEVTLVEVRCETDFCSRNDEFKAMVQDVTKMASKAAPGPVAATPEITARVHEALNKIRENMSFARGIKIAAPTVAWYRHHNGKVGVVVGAEGDVSGELLTDLCMHVAFADPMGISVEDIPPEIVAKEKEIAKAQAVASGKPPEIAEKMVVGKVRKFLEERALLEQLIALEDKYGKKKVKDVLGKAKVTAFARFAVGA